MLGARGATEALSPDRHVLALSRADGGDITLFHLDGDNRPTRLGIAPAGATALGQLVLAFSPDGEVLAAGNDTGTVVLYDVSDPRHAAVIGTPLRAGSTAVGAIAFSHDGTVLAAAGDDATVHRWAVGDHGVAAELAPVPGPDDVLALAFTPAGTSLVVAGRQGAVAVWNVAGERPVRTATLAAGVTTADAAAYSPDGSVLAVGSRDKTVRLWRISDRHYTPLPSLAPFTSMVNALDFSADGSALAAGSSDRSIVVFETATWTAQRTLPGPAPVTGVRFLADDRSIASVADDGSLRLWTLPGHALVGARDNIFNLSYTADGRTLIVGPAGEDNTVEQWDVADEMHPRPAGPNIESDGDTFSGAAVVSPDGTLVASGTVDGTVQLYDRTDPARPVPVGGALRNGKLLVESTAFSPDGRLLVVCTDDGGVRLWNVRDPSAPTLLATITERDKAFSASFSPDGKLLAVADGADVAFLYDIGTPDDPHELATLRGFTDTVYSTAFTRDGTTLVVGSADRSVRVWDVSDPEQPRPVGGRLTGPGGGIYFLALGAEDTRLAAASLDGTVWVWDFTDRAHPVRFASLSVTDVSQFVVAFSPDGRILSGAGQDRVVHDWMTDPGQAMAQVCATTGDSITRAEWRTYLPDQAYDPPCP